MKLLRRLLLSCVAVFALTGCNPTTPFGAPIGPGGGGSGGGKVVDGWIAIDRMGLSRQTFLDSDGSERSLNYGPSRVFGTAEMCQPGNAVIAGHRTTKGGPFRNINRLQIGDLVHVEPASTPGRPCTYMVVQSRILYVGDAASNAATSADVLSQAPRYGSDTRLTLSSCTRPDGSPTSTSYRYIVELVKV